VGYQIGMDRQAGRNTKLTFVTTGVLKQQIVSSRSLSKWTHIILDEGNDSHPLYSLIFTSLLFSSPPPPFSLVVHERDLDSDFVMVLLKELLSNHHEVKLVIMSATLDSKLFASYFPLTKEVRRGTSSIYAVR